MIKVRVGVKCTHLGTLSPFVLSVLKLVKMPIVLQTVKIGELNLNNIEMILNVISRVGEKILKKTESLESLLVKFSISLPVVLKRSTSHIRHYVDLRGWAS
jgi:uncharacterized membrane protein